MAVSRLSQSTLQNAFSKYNSIWDGKSAVGSMEAISSITLSANQANVEFNNIPQTYSHLQLRGNYQSSSAGDTITLRINGDTGSNYTSHQLSGNGTTASASGNTAEGYSRVGYSAVTTTSYFGVSIIDLLDYTNTNKLKTIRTLNGSDANGSGAVQLRSGLWFKAGSGVTSDAVTSILLLTTGGNFVTYSSFTLYGIK